VVKREWFAGKLRLPEIATFLFIRAGTGKGNKVYAREVAERFGWSRNVATAALNGLIEARLIDKLQMRDADGTMAGVTYTAWPDRAAKTGTTARNPSNGDPCDGAPSSGKPCDIHMDALNEGNAPNTRQPAAQGVVAHARDDNTCEVAAAASALIDQIRALDRRSWVSTRLLTANGLKPLQGSVAAHGLDCVMNALRTVLARALVDGREAGFIRSWGYISGAIRDVSRQREMAKHGLLPGDLCGSWRDNAGTLEVPF